MRLALVIIALAAPAAAWTAPCAPGAPPSFTAAQEQRGRAVYAESCALCHGGKLEGGVSPPLTGAIFRARWKDRSFDDFSGYVTGLMPTTAPGSLSPADYAAVIAHLLAANGGAPGPQALPAASKACVLPTVR